LPDNNKFPDFAVIIAAGGRGDRFGGDIPKQYLSLQGEPIVIRAMAPFCVHPFCRRIAVAVHKDWFDWMDEQLSVHHPWGACVTIVPGGQRRGDSVYAGLKAITDSGIVLIHDAARPFVSVQMINDTVLAAQEYGASAIAVAVTDTIKREEGGFIDGTVDRSGLWRVQTPQGFLYKDILKAYEMARKDGYYGTDDCVLVEKYLGMKIKIIPGADYNIKITTQEDYKMASALAISH